MQYVPIDLPDSLPNSSRNFPAKTVWGQVKALLRRGTARIHKNELEGAAGDFRQVLHLEPNNRQAREELKVRAGEGREEELRVTRRKGWGCCTQQCKREGVWYTAASRPPPPPPAALAAAVSVAAGPC